LYRVEFGVNTFLTRFGWQLYFRLFRYALLRWKVEMFEVKQSPIHGQGVFATRSIGKGERIGRYVSRRTDSDGTYVLWVEHGNEWRGYEGYGRLRFLNHRADANAELDGLELFALADIKPGDEITIHYGEEWMDVA
jgi:hypothetical protein